MRLIRSWPLKPPDDHPFVYDNCDRVYMKNGDYSPLAQVGDSVIHLDWDVAVCQQDLRMFAGRCQAAPGLVRVAPTKSYSTRQRFWQKTTGSEEGWMLWNIGPDGSRSPVQPFEPTCHVFAFGLVYLPLWAISGFARACVEQREQWGYDAQFHDVNFGYWHHHITGGRGVPVEWDIHAVHINYSIKDTLSEL